KAIRVVNGLLLHLPQLLGLSASSPFWRGEPTGLSSTRQLVFAAFPRSGPPPRFRDYADYAEVVGQLERTGCIADYTHIWWDIGPHARELGCERELEGVRDILARGTSADGQLRIFNANRDIVEVVRAIADATEAAALATPA